LPLSCVGGDTEISRRPRRARENSFLDTNTHAARTRTGAHEDAEAPRCSMAVARTDWPPYAHARAKLWSWSCALISLRVTRTRARSS